MWVDDLNRECVPNGIMLHQKALSLHKTSARASLKRETSSYLLQVGWLHRFGNRFGWKKSKNYREVASANEEPAAIFLVELKKWIKGSIQSKSSITCKWALLKEDDNGTYIPKTAEEAPGHETWAQINCGTVLQCCRQRLKLSVVYRAKCPRAHKQKQKSSAMF